MPVVQYKHAPSSATRTMSPAIWADCPRDQFAEDSQAGHFFFDDFYTLDPITTNSSIAYSKYYYSGDDGADLTQVADTDFGAVVISGNDADEDGGVLVYGHAAGLARMSSDTNDKVWFECRIKTASVTDASLGFFVGLVEVNVTPTASITLVDASTIPDASEDFVGFWRDGADANTVECIYQENTNTRVNVGDALTDAMLADTYIKLGMKYTGGASKPLFDPEHTVGVLEYFLNGAVIQRLPVDASLNFPDVNALSMCWAAKTPSLAASSMTLDWWGVAATGGNT